MLIEFLARYGLRLIFFIGAAALIGGWLSNIYDGIYENGVNAERVKWQQQEAQATQERDKKIKDMTAAIAVIEKEYAARFAAIGAQHTKEMENANAQKQRDIAAARAGALKLRWSAKDKDDSGGNATGDTARTASISNGAKTSELPAEITANLYTLANDADFNTEQLAACQDVVREYQKFRCKPDKETVP